MDTHDQSAKNIERMTKAWMNETGYRPARPSWLKQLISKIRIWLHQHGWAVETLSDDDLMTMARTARILP